MADEPVSGIYEIVNLVNGKRYVGSAVDIQRRWAGHRYDLRKGKHHSPALQRAWLKYGEASFSFDVIEYCVKCELIAREQVTLDRVSPEYNICKVAGSNLGYRHTKVSRGRQSVAQRRHWEGKSRSDRLAQVAHLRTPEMQAKAAAAKRGLKRPPMTDETKHKLSAARKGQPLLKQRGKIVSEETREKLRLANIGKKQPLDLRQARCALVDDQVRQVRALAGAGWTAGRIAGAFGISIGTVRRACDRSRYQWVDPETPPVNRRSGWIRDPEATARSVATRRQRRQTKIDNGELVIERAPTEAEKTENRRRAAKDAWMRKKAAGYRAESKSEAHRKALSEARKKMFAEGYKTPTRTPEHRAALGVASKLAWADPATKERRRAAIKADWARRKSEGYRHPQLTPEQRERQRAGARRSAALPA